MEHFVYVNYLQPLCCRSCQYMITRRENGGTCSDYFEAAKDCDLASLHIEQAGKEMTVQQAAKVFQLRSQSIFEPTSSRAALTYVCPLSPIALYPTLHMLAPLVAAPVERRLYLPVIPGLVCYL
jgi:hypothetical protein